MIPYILKQLVLSAIAYLLFVGLIKRYPSFRLNRYVIIILVLLTIILPLLQPISLGLASHLNSDTNPVAITLETVSVYANQLQSGKLGMEGYLKVAYYLGLCWGLTRLFLGLYIIRRIRKRSNLQRIGAELIYFSPDIESPFSFWSNTYIPFQYRNEPILPAILAHEQAHLKYGHTWDKLFFSLLQAFFWFNPFMYLFHKEIELQHEFEADAASITTTTNTDYYVEQLLQVVRYQQMPTFLAHHFFHHPLKSRILMLYNTSKANRFQKLFIFSLPLLFSLSFLVFQGFAQPKKKRTPYKILQQANDTVVIEDPASGKINQVMVPHEPDTVYDSVDQMPEFPGGQEKLVSYLVNAVHYTEASRANKIQGTVMVEFVVMNDGHIAHVKTLKKPNGGDELEKEALRVVSAMPAWTPGIKNKKPVKVSYVLPIQFRLSEK